MEAHQVGQIMALPDQVVFSLRLLLLAVDLALLLAPVETVVLEEAQKITTRGDWEIHLQLVRRKETTVAMGLFLLLLTVVAAAAAHLLLVRMDRLLVGAQEAMEHQIQFLEVQ
jgi:hypothetical protein